MAFIGAFFVTILIGIFGVLVWIALALIVLAILFIFIPCLIIAIINLVKGINHHWPKRNIIPLAITGPIVLIFISLFIVYLVWRFGYYVDPYSTSSSAQVVTTLQFLLRL